MQKSWEKHRKRFKQLALHCFVTVSLTWDQKYQPKWTSERWYSLCNQTYQTNQSQSCFFIPFCVFFSLLTISVAVTLHSHPERLTFSTFLYHSMSLELPAIAVILTHAKASSTCKEYCKTKNYPHAAKTKKKRILCYILFSLLTYVQMQNILWLSALQAKRLHITVHNCQLYILHRPSELKDDTSMSA